MILSDNAKAAVATARKARANAESIDYNDASEWTLAEHVGEMYEALGRLLDAIGAES